MIYELSDKLGGKVTSAVPKTRVPDEVFEKELERARKVIPTIHLRQKLTSEEIERLKGDYDFIILAVGAQRPRMLPVPGKEKAITALEFLEQSKKDKAEVGKRVVVIGAGNVGCDVATEAHRLGAEDILLIDIQEPASFGKEREAAEAVGARFRWPCFTRAITDKGVELTTGELIPADTVIVAIGDELEADLLPETVATEKGFVVVNELYQTTDSQIFAIGDAVKLGLLTDAIGAGRKAAEAISEILTGKRPKGDTREMIDYSRVRLEYFDPRKFEFSSIEECATSCASCGACRDCGLCVTICPQGAISRKALDNDDFEMVVDNEKCIGCGFCADACPCGIWNLVENDPMES